MFTAWSPKKVQVAGWDIGRLRLWTSRQHSPYISSLISCYCLSVPYQIKALYVHPPLKKTDLHTVGTNIDCWWETGNVYWNNWCHLSWTNGHSLFTWIKGKVIFCYISFFNHVTCCETQSSHLGEHIVSTDRSECHNLKIKPTWNNYYFPFKCRKGVRRHILKMKYDNDITAAACSAWELLSLRTSWFIFCPLCSCFISQWKLQEKLMSQDTRRSGDLSFWSHFTEIYSEIVNEEKCFATF